MKDRKVTHSPPKRPEQPGYLSMEEFIKEQEAKGKVFEELNSSEAPTVIKVVEVIFIILLSFALFTLVLLLS